MDKEANVFDIQLFHDLCSQRLRKMGRDTSTKPNYSSTKTKNLMSGRPIRTGDSFWTVLRKSSTPLRHPFQPPPPFSDRLSRLRPNNRIQVSHISAADRPRWISRRRSRNELRSADRRQHFEQNGMRQFMNNDGIDNLSLDAIKYREAYSSQPDMKKSSYKSIGYEVKPANKRSKETVQRNVEDLNAVQCLHILIDAKIFSSVEWHSHSSSTTQLILFGLPRLSGKQHENDMISFEKETNMYISNRKMVKQYLAAKALRYIFGSKNKNWTKMTTKEMKMQFLIQKPSRQSSFDEIT